MSGGFRSQEQMRWTMAIWRLSRTSHHIEARISAETRSAFGAETCFPMFRTLPEPKTFPSLVSLNRTQCFELQSLTKKADRAPTRTDTQISCNLRQASRGLINCNYLSCSQERKAFGVFKEDKRKSKRNICLELFVRGVSRITLELLDANFWIIKHVPNIVLQSTIRVRGMRKVEQKVQQHCGKEFLVFATQKNYSSRLLWISVCLQFSTKSRHFRVKTIRRTFFV